MKSMYKILKDYLKHSFKILIYNKNNLINNQIIFVEIYHNQIRVLKM